MKYLKKFELINDYIIWKNSDNYIGPNVSMIDNDDEDDIINYNPLIIINPSVTMNDWTYGETASDPVISGNTGNGTVTYLYKVSSADDSTYTSIKPTDAGTYTIKANINAIRDYSDGSCTSTFTISKTNINPSVTIEDWDEGDTASNPVISGNTGNGTVTYMYKVSSADDSTYTSTIPSTEGTYTIKVTIDATSNYNGATCTTTFTINSSIDESKIIEATYNVTSTSSDTKLMDYSITNQYPNNIDYAEVDGVKSNSKITYRFNSTGLHTVKFILKDDTKTIGSYAFCDCSALISITIPSSITSISGYVFDGCSNLKYIKCNVTSAPHVDYLTFRGVPNYGVLVVPSSNSGYNTWMSTHEYYLGYKAWSKVVDDGSFGNQELTGFYYSTDSVTVTSNYASLPTLTKPSGITVTYASSDTSKATINSSGTVTLKGSYSSDNDGSTFITAFFAGNATYRPKKVGYKLTIDMYTPPSSGGSSGGWE